MKDLHHRPLAATKPVAAGPGAALPASVVAAAQPTFTVDLSRVRTHSDPAATDLTRERGARALTVGEDIFFGAGAAPACDPLTLHEVAHVEQQTAPHDRRPSTDTRALLERDAERVATALARGEPATPAVHAPRGAVQCAPDPAAGATPTVVPLATNEAAALALWRSLAVLPPLRTADPLAAPAAESDEALLRRLRAGPPLSPAAFEAALAAATLQAALARQSLLPQAYLREALQRRRANPNLRAAFAQASQLAGSLTLLAQLDLAGALSPELLAVAEGEFIRDPSTTTLDLLSPQKRALYKGTPFVNKDYPGATPPGPNQARAAALGEDMNRLRPTRRANTSDTAVLPESRYLKMDRNPNRVRALDRDRSVVTTDPNAPQPVQAPRDDIDIDYVLRNYIVDEIPPFTPVPGLITPQQSRNQKIHHLARDSFVKMREAARRDGVSLVVLDGYRSFATAKARAASAKNSNAIASYSSHTLGLAVDLELSFRSQSFVEKPAAGGKGPSTVEARTVRRDYKETDTDMANVVASRNSPVHKWMFLHGAEYGWYAYHNEPWHWEYNPPGFRAAYLRSLSLPDEPAPKSGH